MRARTGSGKTAAFSIPVIQKILTLKQTSTHQESKALILAPSKELCNQIYKVIKDLTIKCSREVFKCKCKLYLGLIVLNIRLDV